MAAAALSHVCWNIKSKRAKILFYRDNRRPVNPASFYRKGKLYCCRMFCKKKEHSLLKQPVAVSVACPFKGCPLVKKSILWENRVQKRHHNGRKHKTKPLIWLFGPRSFHCLCIRRTPLIFGLSVALQVKSLATAIATYSGFDVKCIASSFLPPAGKKN